MTSHHCATPLAGVSPAGNDRGQFAGLCDIGGGGARAARAFRHWQHAHHPSEAETRRWHVRFFVRDAAQLLVDPPERRGQQRYLLHQRRRARLRFIVDSCEELLVTCKLITFSFVFSGIYIDSLTSDKEESELIKDLSAMPSCKAHPGDEVGSGGTVEAFTSVRCPHPRITPFRR